MFTPDLNRSAVELFLDLKPGAKVVSLKPLVLLKTRKAALAEDEQDSIEAIFRSVQILARKAVANVVVQRRGRAYLGSG